MYQVVGGGPAPLELSVPDGTSLLISGPSMTRTSELALDVLAAGHRSREGTTVVSTENDADALRRSFADRVPIDDHRFGVVDCTGRRTGEGLSGPGRVQHVPSPNDLTGIGIGITRAMEALRVPAGRYRLALDSLSTLLSYRDARDVFKFCHVLVSRLGSPGCLSVFTLDTDAHEERTVNMISRSFDGAVEIRQTPAAADHELRFLGLDRDGAWRPVDLP